MKKILLLLSLSILFIVSCAEDTNLTEPTDILAQSFARSEKIESAQFKVNFRFKAPGMDNELSATVYMLRDKANEAYPMKIFAEYSDGNTIAYDNDTFMLIDNQNKQFITISQDNDPKRFLIENFLNSAFEMAAPVSKFDDYLPEFRDSLKLAGIEEVDGVKAYVLTSNKFYPEFNVHASMKLFIRKSDLFRIREEIYQIRDTDTVSYITDLKDIKINPKISPDKFTLKKPEGYQEEKYDSPSNTPAVDVGSDAPDFRLKDEKGDFKTLADYKGNVLVLDFWGTWCKWCVRAMPELQKVHQHFQGKNAIVLGISCQEPDDADPVKFKKDKNVTYKTLLEGDQVAMQYGVTGFPTLFVIDKQGTVIYRKSGFSETMADELIELVSAQLQ